MNTVKALRQHVKRNIVLRIHCKTAEISQSFTMWSCPTVRSRFLDSSTSMATILCFASWNTARDGLLKMKRSVVNFMNKWTNLKQKIYTHKNSLGGFQLGVTRFAHTHIKLKAHRRNGVSRWRAAVANCTTTASTVMLSQPQLPLIHHRSKVPEKWTITSLACIRISPLRSLRESTVESH